MGNVFMAIIGSVSGTGLLVLAGCDAIETPIQLFAAYLAGGLIGMALSVAAGVLQPDV